MLDIPPSDLLPLAKDVHVKGRMISDIGPKHESFDSLLTQLVILSTRSLSYVITHASVALMRLHGPA